jgi:hypothetical protein
MMNRYLTVAVFLITGFGLANCTPKVEVTVPSEPVTINLNVKIEHEIRIKVEKDLDDVFNEESGLF